MGKVVSKCRECGGRTRCHCKGRRKPTVAFAPNDGLCGHCRQHEQEAGKFGLCGECYKIPAVFRRFMGREAKRRAAYEPTEQEIEALVAEQMQNLPDWWFESYGPDD